MSATATPIELMVRPPTAAIPNGDGGGQGEGKRSVSAESDVKDEGWCLHRRSIRLVLLLVFMGAYVCMGAGVFRTLEMPLEAELRGLLLSSRQNFMSEHKCVSDEKLEEFIVEILKAAKRGVSAARNVTMSESNWSFGQALFFSSTILTTIGYGKVTPLSDAGKGFCILYAMVGIPLTLILFTAIVERLMIPTKLLLYALYQRLGHLYKVFHIQLMHLGLVFTVLIVFIFVVPAAIYTALEPEWNYLDSFYYVFISLTTIGLGDFIPGDNPDQPYRVLYKLCTTCYLLVGLLMMMLTLAVLYEIPELNLGLHFYLRHDLPRPVEGSQLRSEQTKLTESGSAPRYTKAGDSEAAEPEPEPEGQSYQGTERLVPGK